MVLHPACFTCDCEHPEQPRSNQKVFFDVALRGDNELITGMEKLSGIADYGVNAVERNRG